MSAHTAPLHIYAYRVSVHMRIRTVLKMKEKLGVLKWKEKQSRQKLFPNLLQKLQQQSINYDISKYKNNILFISSSVPGYNFFCQRKRQRFCCLRSSKKLACIENGNIRRNFIASGSKENSKAMLPLKNEIKWAYVTPHATEKLICIASHPDI